MLPINRHHVAQDPACKKSSIPFPDRTRSNVECYKPSDQIELYIPIFKDAKGDQSRKYFKQVR